MAKATTTIRQTLNHKPLYGAWFAANQTLFNQVAFPLYPSYTTSSNEVEAMPQVLRLATTEGWKKLLGESPCGVSHTLCSSLLSQRITDPIWKQLAKNMEDWREKNERTSSISTGHSAGVLATAFLRVGKGTHHPG